MSMQSFFVNPLIAYCQPFSPMETKQQVGAKFEYKDKFTAFVFLQVWVV